MTSRPVTLEEKIEYYRFIQLANDIKKGYYIGADSPCFQEDSYWNMYAVQYPAYQNRWRPNMELIERILSNYSAENPIDLEMLIREIDIHYGITLPMSYYFPPSPLLSQPPKCNEEEIADDEYEELKRIDRVERSERKKKNKSIKQKYFNGKLGTSRIS